MQLPIVFLVCLFEYAVVAEDMTYFVGPEQAGIIEIGDEAQYVYRLFPKDRRKLIDLNLEGSLTPALALTLPGTSIEPGIVAELRPKDSQLLVSRIRIRDPAMKTAKGIRVGSTMKELRSSYEVTYIASGEGQVFAVVESLSASFQLDNKRFDELYRVKDPSEVPDNVIITSILLTKRY